jgi:hypothetical protein
MFSLFLDLEIVLQANFIIIIIINIIILIEKQNYLYFLIIIINFTVGGMTARPIIIGVFTKANPDVDTNLFIGSFV